jgi:hypothetical protein
MIINLNIDTREDLSENDKVVLLALAGEISLAEGKATEPVQETPKHTPSPEGLAAIERDTALTETESILADSDTMEALAEAKAEPTPEPEKAPKKVNVSEASLKKYGFHIAENGDVTCDHCEYVSETGRALHLHAGTHKDEATKPTLKSVKDEPEAGVDAFLGSEEPSVGEVEEVAKEIQGAPDPEPEVVEAKVVETDPKALRDKVAKVATAMVAAQRQGEIRKVLDELGVARVSMVAEADLQKFLDAEPIAAFAAKDA